MRTASRFIAAAIVAAALGMASGAFAGDLYTVKGVHVDETAKSAMDARALARASGQRLAFGMLLKRLTLPEDWPSLPQPDDKTVQDAVRGFQVASEKTSSTRYIADLNVSFQPETVKRMLKARNIAYGETQAKPALLIAVFDKAGVRTLWEDQNPWRDAWAASDISDAMTPLVLPMGDAQEMSMLTAEQAISGDKTALSTLAARYGADEVVVAYASTNADGSKLDVTATRYDASGSKTIKRSYQATTQGPDAFDTMAKGAASDLLLALGEDWKRAIVVRSGEAAQLTASVYFTTLDQWETIRKGLASAPLVEGMQIDGIAAGGAEVQINYRGTPDKLALSLAQSNIALAQDADGWSLRLR
jgi:hypothetical protein